MLRVVEQSLNPGLREAPSACVQWLFLGPYDVLSVGVLVKILLELSPWEGIQLFDAGDGRIFNLFLGAMFM